MSTLLRWYLYDTRLAEPNTLVEELGLNKVSEEGEDKEKEDSDNRLANIATMFPFMDTIADFSVNTMLAMQITKAEEHDEEVSEEDLETSGIIYKAIAMSTLIGFLSIATHLDIIHPTLLNSGELDMEIDDE
jgi:transcriptional regulator with GAF, ATPase, and Fis domain